jgi:hypothetical protein
MSGGECHLAAYLCAFKAMPPAERAAPPGQLVPSNKKGCAASLGTALKADGDAVNKKIRLSRRRSELATQSHCGLAGHERVDTVTAASANTKVGLLAAEAETLVLEARVHGLGQCPAHEPSAQLSHNARPDR